MREEKKSTGIWRLMSHVEGGHTERCHNYEKYVPLPCNKVEEDSISGARKRSPARLFKQNNTHCVL